jgi:hypothetical protein
LELVIGIRPGRVHGIVDRDDTLHPTGSVHDWNCQQAVICHEPSHRLLAFMLAHSLEANTHHVAYALGPARGEKVAK